MINLINGNDREKHKPLIREMHQLRKCVFFDRLRWDVQIQDDMEIDQYDEINPLYVLATDETNTQVLGSLRLLPTIGPNMLANTFSSLLGENEIVKSPIIWESSRFCVDTESNRLHGDNGVHLITIQLLCALAEIGMEAGLSHIVTVIDRRMERILKRLDCAGERLGTPKKIGKVTALAGLWSTDMEMLTKLQKAGGIKGSVLAPHAPIQIAA